MIESFGARISRLRAAYGWTQQELAERIAVSRVAISHWEMGLGVPSERTVTLLAGVFKQEPWELVADSTYPAGKAARLPLVAARYTVVEHELCLLDRDLHWLDQLHDARLTFDTCQAWLDRLSALDASVLDPRERQLLATARDRLLRVTSDQ